MYNSITVIAVPSSCTSNNNMFSYPILEQDDVIIHDYLNNNNNNNNLKAKVIINVKMYQRQHNSSTFSSRMQCCFTCDSLKSHHNLKHCT